MARPWRRVAVRAVAAPWWFMGRGGRHLHYVVGMSGGVDSTLTAHLLKQQGHEVTGVFMRTWDELDETGVCTAEGDWRHVQDIAQRLGIPCKRVDFVQEYWHSVFQVMLDELAAGATPNPDILCNRHIKFDAFYHFARDQLGADRVAMGHYARVDEREPDMPRLLRGCDDNKDQSYFLAGLPVHVLRHAAFPLGHLTKDRVKALAAAAGFSDVAGQRESMGLCFVGKRRFGALVQQYLPPRPGVFVHLESGRQLGPVTDLNVITFGQSARLDGQPVRCYVAGKDMTAGAAYVVEGLHHPCLHARAFALSNVHWTHPPPQDVEANLHVRIRHRGQLHPCAVGPLPGPFDSIKGTPAQAEEQFFTDLSLWQVSGHAPGQTQAARWARACTALSTLTDQSAPPCIVQPFEPVHGVCVGQQAVIYNGEECLGSGQVAAVFHLEPTP